jgi:hypothetical protein
MVAVLLLVVAAQAAWPECQWADTILRGAGKYALFTDLTAVGKTKGCFQQKCQASDKYKASSAAECAMSCTKVDGCKFWSFGEESSEKKCWVRTGDGGREALASTVSGAVDCVPPEWPGCQEPNTILRGSKNGNWALHSDVTVHGKTSGCFENNCKATDKFDCATIEECATTCYQVPECTHYSFGNEAGVKKCWLRKGDGGKEPDSEGRTSASRHCAPEDAFATSDVAGLNSFQGVWSLTYTNGHRDTYTIDASGQARRAQGGATGNLQAHGTGGDHVKDPNYSGKYYATAIHRPAVWEYMWGSADGQKLFLRHFCTDGACTETSPEGSGNYCCSATGDKVGPGPEKHEL